jgi:hypothetical protein
MTEDRIQPLTEDQLALISQETDRAVNKALKMYTRRAIVGFLILLAGVFYAISAGQKHDDDARKLTASEGAKRQDQICRVFESQHLREVNALSDRHQFIEDAIKANEEGSLLVQALIRQLPEVDAAARQDPAPDFCDEKVNGKDLGLPEPDPFIPEARDYSRYLKR